MKPAVIGMVAILFISLMFILYSKYSGPDLPNSTEHHNADAADEQVEDVPESYVTLKVIMPGDLSARMGDFVENELNDRLKKDLNMKLELTYIPWSNYQQKLELALSTGEDYDLFWYGAPFVSVYYTKGYIQPLDELLDQYGQDLIKHIPDENFKQNRIDEKLWAIPSQAFTSAGKFSSVMVRQDLLEKVNLSEIKTIADLELFFKRMQAIDPSYYGYLETDRGHEMLWRELTDRNYSSLDERMLFMVDEDSGEMLSYVESDVYKKVAQLRESWVNMGIIDKNLVGNPAAKIDQENAGKLLFRVGAVSRAMENLQTARNADPNARLREYYLAKEKPKFITTPSNEAFMITAASENPERAMMFMNWILKNKDNYNFIIYGVEGKDYELENGKIKQLTNDQLIYEWMWRNKDYFLAPASVEDDIIDDMLMNDENSRISKLFGFHFNEASVKNEMAQVMAVYKEKIEPINFGLASYEEYYEDAIAALKKAGFDIVFAELKKQFSEFQLQH
ncbi:putative aldouronate transport system substrate-binding protein [Paenibacillus endophyticus]|uniref:Putative aldouronate transport system substrate-binding protein n=1 Tax=Paenibacillus endophyticus TaxID=1294268 RepID=A0A7W5C9K6_9BACL|nr:extracellular solute-binding protein [Paenibacillus endophyticus]MBB3153532.1 putative aldouronate transport system substrate-binding protein [Paenibacillus endophyticus]